MRLLVFLCLVFSWQSLAMDKVNRQMLTAHNHFRNLEGFERMQFSSKLANEAQRIADTCSPQTRSRYATQYFRGSRRIPSLQIVDTWRPEGHKHRNFWLSTWLGCGESKCGKDRVVVCAYYPGVWG